MKILVTGASGYVAKFVIEGLGKGHDLVLFSRRHPSEGRYSTQTEAPFIRGDLTRLEECRRAVAGVDAIAHIGGMNEPSGDTFRTNALGTYYLLEAAREAGVRRIVLASSNCALGHCFRVSGRPFEAKYFPFDEAHPSFVEDNYGLSKLVNEQTLEAYSRAYEFRCVALRLNWCWGPAEIQWRMTQPFNSAKHAAEFWAYVDMRDVATAFRLALEAAPSTLPPFGSYFISAPDTMADELSADLVERYYPQYGDLAQTLEGRETFFSWRAAQRVLGFEPHHTWRRKGPV